MASGGIPLDSKTPPNLRRYIENADRNSGSDTIGVRWRLFEGPWPTRGEAICLQIQYRQGSAWVTMAAFSPDGTFIGGNGAKPVGARYKRGTALALGAGVFTVVDFNSKDYDTNSCVTTGATWNFKVPEYVGGLFQVSANVGITGFAANAATEDFVASIFVNGVEAARGQRVGAGQDSAAVVNISVSDILKLKQADVVDVRVFSGQARSLIAESVSNHVAICRIPIS